MTVEEILKELRRLGEPQRVAALKRSGVASIALGVGMPELRSMAKRIGRDHERAFALWQEPIREARILPTLIAAADTSGSMSERAPAGALRQIGKRSGNCERASLTPSAPNTNSDRRGYRWVARDVVRELLSEATR